MTDSGAVEFVEFVAAVAQVRTLADGGIRYVFDGSEDSIAQAAWIMQAKRQDEAVRVRVERVREFPV